MDTVLKLFLLVNTSTFGLAEPRFFFFLFVCFQERFFYYLEQITYWSETAITHILSNVSVLMTMFLSVITHVHMM